MNYQQAERSSEHAYLGKPGGHKAAFLTSPNSIHLRNELKHAQLKWHQEIETTAASSPSSSEATAAAATSSSTGRSDLPPPPPPPTTTTTGWSDEKKAILRNWADEVEILTTILRSQKARFMAKREEVLAELLRIEQEHERTKAAQADVVKLKSEKEALVSENQLLKQQLQRERERTESQQRELTALDAALGDHKRSSQQLQRAYEAEHALVLEHRSLTTTRGRGRQLDDALERVNQLQAKLALQRRREVRQSRQLTQQQRVHLTQATSSLSHASSSSGAGLGLHVRAGGVTQAQRRMQQLKHSIRAQEVEHEIVSSHYGRHGKAEHKTEMDDLAQGLFTMRQALQEHDRFVARARAAAAAAATRAGSDAQVLL